MLSTGTEILGSCEGHAGDLQILAPSHGLNRHKRLMRCDTSMLGSFPAQSPLALWMAGGRRCFQRSVIADLACGYIVIVLISVLYTLWSCDIAETMTASGTELSFKGWE